MVSIAAGVAALAAPAAGAADGREIYAKTCAVCHNNMPPNAGNKSLSEADIRAAVEYLVSQSK